MSSVSDEKAIITLEVELVSKVTGLEGETPPDPFLSDVSGSEFEEAVKKMVEESVGDATEQALSDAGLDSNDVDKLSGFVKDVDQKGMANITKLATNPQGFLESQFIQTLRKAGPHGALVAAIITAIVGTPELAKALIRLFAVKGAPLNQDFEYSQAEQYNQQFDRRIQFKRLTGDDPVITVTTQGYVVGDPDFKGNSLISANIAKTGRVGLRDSAHGYIHGI